MDETTQALKKALEAVSDTYDDFVDAFILFCGKDEKRAEKMLDFLATHKEATTSETIDFYYDEVEGD